MYTVWEQKTTRMEVVMSLLAAICGGLILGQVWSTVKDRYGWDPMVTFVIMCLTCFLWGTFCSRMIP